jgi:hypothetical protein
VGGLRAATRRGLLRRPVLLFGLLLLVPAGGFCWLGWRSVEREARARRTEATREVADILARRMEVALADLEAIRRVEEAREYFEYQPQYVPKELIGENVALQGSALVEAPTDPREHRG